jgi:hypothetical protein
VGNIEDGSTVREGKMKDESPWKMPGTEKYPEQDKMEKLIAFVANDSLKNKEPPAYYRKRLEQLKEMLDEHIEASESMSPHE